MAPKPSVPNSQRIVPLTPGDAVANEESRSGAVQRDVPPGQLPELVRDASVRMLAEDSHHEAAVMEGLRGDVAPLSEADLAGVRQRVREARGRRSP